MRKLEVAQRDPAGWGAPAVDPAAVDAPGTPAAAAATQEVQAANAVQKAINSAGTMPPPPLKAPLTGPDGLVTTPWAMWLTKKWTMDGGSIPMGPLDSLLLVPEVPPFDQQARDMALALGLETPQADLRPVVQELLQRIAALEGEPRVVQVIQASDDPWQGIGTDPGAVTVNGTQDVKGPKTFTKVLRITDTSVSGTPNTGALQLSGQSSMTANIAYSWYFGGGSTLGFYVGMDASMNGYCWLKENTALYIGANNVVVMTATGTVVKASVVFRGASGIFSDAASGTNSFIMASAAGSARWAFSSLGTEGASDAGYNFTLYCYTNAGALIDFPLDIVRAAGGAITLRRPTACTSTFTATSVNGITGLSSTTPLVESGAGAAGAATTAARADHVHPEAGSGNVIVEYAYNTSTTTASDTTSFATGPNGAAIQAFAPGSGTYVSKRVRFSDAVLETDRLEVEFAFGAPGAGKVWVSQDTLFPFSGAAPGSGVTLAPNATTTDVDVQFASNGFTGVSWTGSISGGRAWRLKRTRVVTGITQDIYSTGEVMTNKVWVDGKPIYRKVLNFGALPNATSKTVAHGITGITQVTSRTGTATTGANFLALPHVDPAGITAAIELYSDLTNVTVITGNSRTTYTSCYVTLEYTK